MVGTRRVFFNGSLNYIPNYEQHRELNSQRHFKRTVDLFERLLMVNEAVVVYGATLSYARVEDPPLTVVQGNIRAWINGLKMRDVQKRIVGIAVAIEEGKENERTHLHALVFCRDIVVHEEVMWDMQELWEDPVLGVTGGLGVYHNDNWESERLEAQGDVGALGYVHYKNVKKIERTLYKIAYNTKDNYTPSEARLGKRKCFICEEYE